MLQGCVENKNRLVISAIMYAELRFSAIGKKVMPKQNLIVDQFMERIDVMLPWDKAAAEATAAIAGNSITAAGYVLITNKAIELERVPDLRIEN